MSSACSRESRGIGNNRLKKKGLAVIANPFIFIVAEWTGLEPATPGVTGRYSNQLNYHSSCGGRNRDRTCDPRLVRPMLSQLSYSPHMKCGKIYSWTPNPSSKKLIKLQK